MVEGTPIKILVDDSVGEVFFDIVFSEGWELGKGLKAGDKVAVRMILGLGKNGDKRSL